jgi:Cys-tRNA(Pro)/Cys-tRNA(Cys) deacylase
MLEQAGATFSLHVYAYDPEAKQIGMQAAEALGARPDSVLKTLMASVDARPVCAIVPSDREVSMKRLAVAAGGKAARMLDRAEAERLSGYTIGGISPFGQTRRVPIFIEQEALAHPLVYINGGQRGLQVRLDPHMALAVLRAVAAPLIA